ncbi:uncharacterized protein [Narcine bancroftii]|uniref:uncharacterized protein n=1 Tax=Narcine bancroftii TaxID=1343680 RepID=UPI0038312005
MDASDKKHGLPADDSRAPQPPGSGHQPRSSPGGRAPCDPNTSPDGTCPFPTESSGSDDQDSSDGSDQMFPLTALQDSNDTDSSSSGTCPMQPGGDESDQMLPLAPEPDLDESDLSKYPILDLSDGPLSGDGSGQMIPMDFELDLDDSVQLDGDESDQMLPLAPEPDLDESDLRQYPILDLSDGLPDGDESDQSLPVTPDAGVDDSDLSQHPILDLSDVAVLRRRRASDFNRTPPPNHVRARRHSLPASAQNVSLGGAGPSDGDESNRSLPVTPFAAMDDSDLSQHPILDLSDVAVPRRRQTGDFNPLPPRPNLVRARRNSFPASARTGSLGGAGPPDGDESDQSLPVTPDAGVDDSDLSQHPILDLSDVAVPRRRRASDFNQTPCPNLVRARRHSLPASARTGNLSGAGPPDGDESDLSLPVTPVAGMDDSDLSQHPILDLSDVAFPRRRRASDFNQSPCPNLVRARRHSFPASARTRSLGGADQSIPDVGVPFSPRTTDVLGIFHQPLPESITEATSSPRKVPRLGESERSPGRRRPCGPGNCRPCSGGFPAFDPAAPVDLTQNYRPIPAVNFIPDDPTCKFPEAASSPRKVPRLRESKRFPGRRRPCGPGTRRPRSGGFPAFDPAAPMDVTQNYRPIPAVNFIPDDSTCKFPEAASSPRKVPRLNESERSPGRRRPCGPGTRRPRSGGFPAFDPAIPVDLTQNYQPIPAVNFIPDDSTCKFPVPRSPAKWLDATTQDIPAMLSAPPVPDAHRSPPAAGTCPIRLASHTSMAQSAAATAPGPSLMPEPQLTDGRESKGQSLKRRGFGGGQGLLTPPRPGLRALGMEPLHGDNPHWRVIGEIAFQLDRRILSYVFNMGIRMYGFRVMNVPEKINQVSTSTAEQDKMSSRYREIIQRLQRFGYRPPKHPMFAESIVNSFGIIREKSRSPKMLANYNDPDYLKKTIHEEAPLNLVFDLMVLLNCLASMSVNDGRPLFIW